jgi:hypothetical protein
MGESERPMGGEREQPGKPGKGESAQAQQPENRMQSGNTENGTRAGQPGAEVQQNRTGQAQMGQAPNRESQAGGQAAARNVQASGKTTISHDKAAGSPGP